MPLCIDQWEGPYTQIPGRRGNQSTNQTGSKLGTREHLFCQTNLDVVFAVEVPVPSVEFRTPAVHRTLSARLDRRIHTPWRERVEKGSRLFSSSTSYSQPSSIMPYSGSSVEQPGGYCPRFRFSSQADKSIIFKMGLEPLRGHYRDR